MLHSQDVHWSVQTNAFHSKTRELRSLGVCWAIRTGDAHSKYRELRSQGRSLVVETKHDDKIFSLASSERVSKSFERKLALAVLGVFNLSLDLHKP